MRKIKISHDYKYYKILFFIFIIISFIVIYINKREENGVEFLFPFLFFMPIYFYEKLELISYNKTDLSLEFGKIIVTKDRIVEISKLYFYINREHVWKIYYLDENDKLRATRFVPVDYTFEHFIRLIEVQAHNVKVNYNFQSNRIW